MADLKALNRRKYLTGRELGILEVENLCEIQRYNNDLSEGRKYSPVIKDREKFKAKLRLINEDEKRVYDNYIQLHHWLMEESREEEIEALKAEKNMGDLNATLIERRSGEELAQYLAKWDPSEEEYNDLPFWLMETQTPAALLDEAGGLTDAGKIERDWNYLLRGLTVNAIYRIRAYNYALERIAALLDVSGAVYFKQPLIYVDVEIQKYHSYIEQLKNAVKKGADPARGLKAVKALYRPITENDIGDLDEDARAQIDALITSFDGLYGQPPISRYFKKAKK